MKCSSFEFQDGVTKGEKEHESDMFVAIADL